ncbi:MAG TPA: hypothetical protein VHZ98_02355 [Galbitalea sp.]|jgi:hypothetical protein|nr:hypothetical protein [Galbitalea sp.]
MNKPRALATLAAVGAAAILLTGCVQGNPHPSAGQTHSASPTPRPTYSPIGDPGSAEPPASQDDAWVAANKTVKDFLAVQYEIEHDAGANPNRIDPYANGTALSGVHQVAAGLAEKGITTHGAPKWTPSAVASSFGTLLPTGGAAIANGIVYVKGCYDVTGQTATYASGAPAPVSSTRVFPVEFNVEYVPDAKSWMVNNSQSILGQAGAPAC